MAEQTQVLLPRPRAGQVWLSRWLRGRYVAVLGVREDRVKFAPVRVSPGGLVTRDDRCGRPLWDTAAGLRRAFARTDLRLELVPRPATRPGRSPDARR